MAQGNTTPAGRRKRLKGQRNPRTPMSKQRGSPKTNGAGGSRAISRDNAQSTGASNNGAVTGSRAPTCRRTKDGGAPTSLGKSYSTRGQRAAEPKSAQRPRDVTPGHQSAHKPGRKRHRSPMRSRRRRLQRQLTKWRSGQ